MGIWFVLGVLAIDQITKIYIIRHLTPETPLPVVEGVFYITYVKNKGSAFGLFPDHTRFFIFMTLLLVLFLIVYLRDLSKESAAVRLGLAAGIGGAMGNFIDRVRLGYVVDFLDFRIWPIFNIADIAIVLGAALIFLGAVRHKSVGRIEEGE